jgi:PPOX class probable F420-dependent enzyme
LSAVTDQSVTENAVYCPDEPLAYRLRARFRCSRALLAIGKAEAVCVLLEDVMIISDEIRQLIATGPLAHLTTLNADGSPQVSVVWVGIEGDEFVSGHMGAWQKVKNVRRDPRVALSLLGRGKNPLGLQEYLVVYGEARITEGGAAALLQRLAEVYLGPDVEFPPEPFRSRPGYITRITPHRLAGVGPWSLGQR